MTLVLYVGKTKYKREVHPGEHQGIVAEEVWQQVQGLLGTQGQTKGSLGRNRFGALLKGLLHCSACGRSMTPAHSTRNGSKRYRYYVCTAAQKMGWHKCPAPSLAALPVEQVVLEQLKLISGDCVPIQTLLGQRWQAVAPDE